MQALNMFNQEYDRRFYEISNKFEELENQMKEHHNKEIEDKTNEFEDMFVNCPQKAAPEILNHSKILETLVRKKEYTKALDLLPQVPFIVSLISLYLLK